MTDIVERSRENAPMGETAVIRNLMYHAADEIEQLRDLVDQCDHHEHSLQEAHERLAALENENGRLRGVIRRAAKEVLEDD